MDLRRYARTALDVIEARALYLDDADWPTLRAAVLASAAAADDVSQVHETLRHALHQVGGAHSFLVPPGAGGTTTTGASQLPTARAEGDVGILHLPTCAGGRDVLCEYVEAGGVALRTIAGARAWVVDLRDNRGGNMWPMLAVVAPLLGGDGVLGGFTDRGGRHTVWSLRRGKVRLGWLTQARSRGPRELPGPVAVLLGPATASSGEAVAIAFRGAAHARSYGAPTHGFATANDTVRLEDGAVLAVTTATMADRHGVVQHGQVSPDVLVAPPDDVLELALTELAQRLRVA